MKKILSKSGAILGIISLLFSLNYLLQENLTPAIAQQNNSKPKKSKPKKFWLPSVAQNLSVGTHRTSAGSRGSDSTKTICLTVEKDLTALVPEYKIGNDKLVWGLTASKHPTLWFYIPYSGDSVSQVSFELSLPTNENQTVYKTSIKLPQQPGFISVSLPKTIPPLAINKFYKWELGVTLNCPLNSYVYVDGWIQRVNVDSGLSEQIAQATPKQQAGLYAESGFWYDALTILAQLRRTKQQDRSIAGDWVDLLQSISLDKLASESFSPVTHTQIDRNVSK
jgi:Domain of Unknown Function (DUF928)